MTYAHYPTLIILSYEWSRQNKFRDRYTGSLLADQSVHRIHLASIFLFTQTTKNSIDKAICVSSLITSPNDMRWSRAENIGSQWAEIQVCCFS